MIKYSKSVTIYLPKENHAKCPIYEHEGKFYIIPNKPNTKAYNGFWLNGKEYSEVVLVNGYWFSK